MLRARMSFEKRLRIFADLVNAKSKFAFVITRNGDPIYYELVWPYPKETQRATIDAKVGFIKDFYQLTGSVLTHYSRQQILQLDKEIIFGRQIDRRLTTLSCNLQNNKLF